MMPAYIFPTEYKARIPLTLSYPIGAERTSEALQDVPQAKVLTISFSHYNRAARPKEKVKVFPVFEASYCHSRPTLSSSNDMIERGWYRPKWQLTVRAVPRALKHTIMQLLLGEGLPRVRLWLITHEGLMGADAYRRITLIFDEQASVLRFEEYSGA